MLRNLVIVEEARAETVIRDAVHIGCTVTVVEEDYGDPESYLVVGSAEADPSKARSATKARSANRSWASASATKSPSRPGR